MEVVGEDSLEMDLAFRGGFFRVAVEAPDMDVALFRVSATTVFPGEDGVTPSLVGEHWVVLLSAVFESDRSDHGVLVVASVSSSRLGEHLLEMNRPFFGTGMVLAGCFLIFLWPFRRGDNELFFSAICQVI